MNYFAIIGIVKKTENFDDDTLLTVAVEKTSEHNRGLTEIEIYISNDKFEDEINNMKESSVVGIKGYIGKNNTLTAEGVQIF
jgi:hypothetical protein